MPDLQVQREFMQDFGFAILEDNDTVNGGAARLYGQGQGGRAYFYVVEKGEPAFLGVGFALQTRDDLVTLAGCEGASPIEALEGPGGGERVRFVDPNGFEVDAVYGQPVLPLAGHKPRPPLNFTEAKGRLGEPVRLQPGPPVLRRVGHVVLNVHDFRLSEAWYKQRFGLRTSDEIYAGDENDTLGAFLRCDLGETPTDHHTLFLIGGREPGVNHVAFEVDDWDAVMLGHDHLVKNERDQHWGVGKHILGSQVFDYWKDPYGNVVEHYTDGDLFPASVAAKREPVTKLLGVQWGPEMPAPAES
ncbi:MAG: VOC family protein [Pseudomonadota bacterium]